MRLAQTITVPLGGRKVPLRPSLRAAMVLEHAHGLATLGVKIPELHVTAIADVIAATADPAFSIAGPDLIAEHLIKIGIPALLELVNPLLALLEGLLGIDPDADEAPAKSDEDRTSIVEAQRALFRIGTGKLGWSVADTFDAMPLEIIEAWRGRIELLGDIFGRSGDGKPKHTGSVDDRFAKLQAALAAHWQDEAA